MVEKERNMIQFDQTNRISMFNRWTDEKKRALHETSLRILSEIGVAVFHEDAKSILRNAGASVVGDLVKISPHLVEKALRSAPDTYSIYSVDGSKSIDLLPNHIYFGTGTDMPEFIDLYTGEIREGQLADCENAAKVAEQCNSIDWIAPYALANDKDPRIADMYHYKAMRKYCSKPISTLATDSYSLKGIIDMAALQAGGYDNLKMKPTFVHYAEPVSPLQNTEEALDKLLLCAEYGIPVTYTSGIMAGATGPATLAGTLAVGNAECLFGLVTHQLKSPGAPFMYGCEASIMDMKTAVCMYGGPEYGLMNSFVGEMGRFYGLPTFGISGATDSNSCDFQMGAEMLYSIMCAIYGRQNFVHDNGYMGLGQMGSLQSILAANELLAFAMRYAADIDFSEQSLAFETIKEVGIGGNYLSRKETAKLFKKEYYFPDILNRQKYGRWMSSGSPSIPEKLTKKAKQIIEGDCPIFLDETLERQFDEVIQAHERYYGIKN